MPKETTGHQEIIKYFCEEAYPKKYGVNYHFQTKEAKMVKDALVYFRKGSASSEEATAKMKKAIDIFLQDGEYKLAGASHPFSWFLLKAHRWIQDKARPPIREMAFVNYPKEREKARLSFLQGDDKAWVDRLMARVQRSNPDPRRWFKGYAAFAWALKKHNPERFRVLNERFVELLGRQRCRDLWRQYREDESFLKADQNTPNRSEDGSGLIHI